MTIKSLRNESVSKKEVLLFLRKSTGDFPLFKIAEVSEQYADKLSRYARFIVTRDIDNHIIAMIAAYTNNPPLCYITHVCVLEEYKRKGLFNRMFTQLQNEAILSNCSIIKLEVRLDNIPAITAYQNRGFKVVGKASDNSIYMQKYL